MDFQTEEQPDKLIGQLEKTRVVEVNRLPEIDELKMLADKGQEKGFEYGVQVVKLEDGSIRTVFNTSSSEKPIIFEPDIPLELRGKVLAGVFTHNHPINPEEEVAGEKTLHVFPSERGDFHAQMLSKEAGGYLNITSKDGVTLNIGIEGLGREEDLTRRLKYKLGAKETAKETNIWKFFTGGKAGKSIVGEQSQKVDEKFSLGDEDVILASHTAYIYTGIDRAGETEIPPIGTVRHFLFISWEKFRELEEDFGGIENLYFGDGVEKLVRVLDLNVHHGKNLSDVCKISWKPPKKRGM